MFVVLTSTAASIVAVEFANWASGLGHQLRERASLLDWSSSWKDVLQSDSQEKYWIEKSSLNQKEIKERETVMVILTDETWIYF